MRYITLWIAAIFFASQAYPQISQGGTPWLYDHDPGFELSNLELPVVLDTNELKEEPNGGLKPYRFGKTIGVDINVKAAASQLMIDDSTRLYLLALSSAQAHSLALVFKAFHLPDQARLFIMNAAKNHYIGAFTSNNNKASGRLAVSPVKGDNIILEYQENIHNAGGKLEIGRFSHHYRDIFNDRQLKDSRYGTSGDCQVGINCEEGSEWQVLKHAVCRILVDGSTFCSGALVNNTAEDMKPYIVTANHCIANQQSAEDVVVVFNYESPSCNGPDGSVIQSVSGASLRATASNLDFSLLELSDRVPPEYKPYYAGWNIKETPPAATVSIHHPSGDVKKIAVDHDPPVTGTYQADYVKNAFWKVEEWDVGTTESGSSGAPLFTTNQQLTGMLTGGSATCSSPVNDYFAKLSESWDYYPDSTSQLSHWLNPIALNTDSFPGFNPATHHRANDAKMFFIISPQDSYCGSFEIQPMVLIKNNGRDTLFNVSVHYRINDTLSGQSAIQKTLIPGELDTLVFKPRQMEPGNHVLKTYTSQPNGQPDDYPENDTLHTSFTVESGVPVSLRLTTDYFGSETRWQVTGPTDSILYEGGPYNNGSMQKINQQFCLDYQHHEFTLYDRKGDGICCDYGYGSYSLVNDKSGETIAQGGVFDSVRTVDIHFPSPAPIAKFRVDTHVVYVNGSTRFSNLSQYEDSVKWFFPGGDPALSTLENPVVTYKKPGSYDVSLSVNNGADVAEYKNHIYVIDSPRIADFISLNRDAPVLEPVRFINKSINAGPPHWKFEGGSPSESDKEHPVVQYEAAGIFDVMLYTAADTAIRKDYIRIQKKVPAYTIRMSSDTVCLSQPVNFSVHPPQPIETYQWQFEGGTPGSSQLEAPAINYEAEGTYAVSVIINDSMEITSAGEIVVRRPPELSINVKKETAPGSLDGFASLMISGGTPPFKVKWSTSATSDSITDQSSGLFSVAVLDAAGCLVTRPLKIAADSATNTLKNLGPDELKLYPNPTSSKLHIQTGKHKYTSWSLWDLKGNKRLSGSLTSASTQMDISGLPRGMYLLELSGDNTSLIKKVIRK